LNLHDNIPERVENENVKLTKNFLREGASTLRRSTIATCNRKFKASLEGADEEIVVDDIPPVNFSFDDDLVQPDMSEATE
jgi:hypothetical protein